MSMILTSTDLAAGLHEFRLRGYTNKVIIFEAADKWWMHVVDAKGRSAEKYWLPFDTVRSYLADQPNALSEAEALQAGLPVP